MNKNSIRSILRISQSRLRPVFILLLTLVLAGCSTIYGAAPDMTTGTGSSQQSTEPQPSSGKNGTIAPNIGGKFVFGLDGSIMTWQNGQYGKIYSKPGVYYTQPSWSPDGRRVVAVEEGTNHSDLIVFAPNGTATHLTDYRSQYNHLASSWAFFPSWSPDGKFIAYITDKGTNAPGRYMQLYIITTDGTLAKLTPYYYDRLAAMEWPRWSPDGKQILVTAWPWQTGPGQLWVIDLATGNFTGLTNSAEGVNDGAWSPDGTYIAYSERSNGTHDIWIMDSDGKNPTKITTSGTNRQPIWIDNHTLAYLSVGPRGAEIWSVTFSDSTGVAVPSTPQQLTDFAKVSPESIDATAGLSYLSGK